MNLEEENKQMNSFLMSAGNQLRSWGMRLDYSYWLNEELQG